MAKPTQTLSAAAQAMPMKAIKSVEEQTGLTEAQYVQMLNERIKLLRKEAEEAKLVSEIAESQWKIMQIREAMQIKQQQEEHKDAIRAANQGDKKDEPQAEVNNTDNEG